MCSIIYCHLYCFNYLKVSSSLSLSPICQVQYQYFVRLYWFVQFRLIKNENKDYVLKISILPFKALASAKVDDKTVPKSHRIDAVFSLFRISFFHGCNIKGMSSAIEKATELIEGNLMQFLCSVSVQFETNLGTLFLSTKNVTFIIDILIIIPSIVAL